jgi:DNA-binding CsgD family transcriptional regulator
MSYLHLLSGAPDAAIERCERGLRRLGDDAGERWARGYLYVIMGTARFLRGETRASSDNARRALRLKHELGDAPGTAYCLEALALLASAEQRDERVTWLHGAASVLWERTGKPFGGNNSLRELLEEVVVGTRGRLGEPRYERLFADGASRALDVVVTSAIGDDSKLPPPRGQGLTSLTRRQSEIAELATRGLTSGQIAEQLVISRRTVDAHIAHIYSKLGISSRAQLAALTAAELAAR